MNALVVTLRRDLLLAGRRRSEVLTTLFFFIVVVSLFPLGIGPEPALLRRIGPGALWVAALLATLLGLPRLFAADHADGTLEQMALSSQSFVLQMAGKVAAHWLLCGLPLVLLSPILGLQFGIEGDALWVLMLSLLVGTPLLSLIGAIGAALTLGVRGGGVLLALLILPLFIPALVFGAGSVDAFSAGLSVRGHLSVLGAMLALATFFAPWATTASLRIAME
ncbi:MAG: heme exporter protein CcmB [Betaproteobacteria bacterium]|nr:MAG: heme exporter protein CcmB [Betaproteobacteria bacterium]